MNHLMQIYNSFPADNRMRAIAEWYDNAPAYRGLPATRYQRCVDAWWTLANEGGKLAKVVRTLISVVNTPESEPYDTASDMCEDIGMNGCFAVSKANCEHPLWTLAQNIDFRVTHDVLGHFHSGGGFDWDGELLACNAHADHLSELAQAALFSECIASTAFRLTYGYFCPQKIALVNI